MASFFRKGVYLLNTMDNIRSELKENIGKRAILKANKGRKKIVTKRGIIDSVYPSVFIIELTGPDQEGRKISFTYSDVLTETVQIAIIDDELADGEKSAIIS